MNNIKDNPKLLPLETEGRYQDKQSKKPANDSSGLPSEDRGEYMTELIGLVSDSSLPGGTTPKRQSR